MHVFDFQELDPFGVAVDMVDCIDAIDAALPQGRGYMRDQLRSAANSVPLNLTEDAGEFARGE